ncbi:MAG: glutamate-1-semialdehyde 2,1-aminomutase [Bacillota bacterium]
MSTQRYRRSEELYQRARDAIVGGVNSPSRSFKAVGGGAPVFIARAQGAYLWDADGNRYIDYLAAYGPVILGHAHPEMTAAIADAASRGTLYGTPTELEVELAERLREAIPSMERVRLVNSGTEAVMTAVRLARAATGRSRIMKFEGCYHGHSDIALVKAGSGPSTLGIADSAGVPPHVAADVITLPFNDLNALKDALDRWGSEVAAILVEPVVGNMGVVAPEPGFLDGVTQLLHQAGGLVIYDEVITAFRFTYGGAQNILGQSPDLTCLGKIIGGGLPIGAYGGRRELMDLIAPSGATYQAGTLAGNPLTVTAGLKALEILRRPGTYEGLEARSRYLADGVLQAAREFGHQVQLNRYGSGFTLFFTATPVRDYATAQTADAGRFARLFRGLLDRGVHLAPSRFEAWFLTIAHSQQDLDDTLEATRQVLSDMRR